uniref:RING-type domain-containing protein n=1 Tax=Zosterops lateralis melanops TaxID=1220523 RepID=A0A8D2P633_ZOSLA
MALAGALERLREEAVCPICLEFMSEPVSIDCGHNFCRGCIARHCQDKGLWADGPFSCPQCRASCHRSGLRPNRQLANLVEGIHSPSLAPCPFTPPGEAEPVGPCGHFAPMEECWHQNPTPQL